MFVEGAGGRRGENVGLGHEEGRLIGSPRVADDPDLLGVDLPALQDLLHRRHHAFHRRQPRVLHRYTMSGMSTKYPSAENTDSLYALRSEGAL